MSYLPATIANYFLNNAAQEGCALTPMQALKLVYIAHGWHLGFLGKPLINEPVEAWQHGPVIRSLYEQLKEFGSGGIPGPLRQRSFALSKEREFPADVVDILRGVWEGYGRLGGFKLSEMTRLRGSPWWETQSRKPVGKNEGTLIDNSTIKDFYEKKNRIKKTALKSRGRRRFPIILIDRGWRIPGLRMLNSKSSNVNHQSCIKACRLSRIATRV